MNDITALAQRPAHIPASAVYDFDVQSDPGLLADPHKRMREVINEAPPVFWTPHNGGHWVVLRHQDVFNGYRDYEHLSNQPMMPEEKARMFANRPPGSKHIPQSVPISLDPPEHGKYRLPLAATFGPKRMAAMTDDIRILAASLIDKVIDQGHCDFIASVAAPLPVLVFLKLMGLPLDRLEKYRHLIREFLAPGVHDQAIRAERYRTMADSIEDIILARKDDPKDDIISLLWASTIDGEPMTLELMEDYGVLLFIAGLDTVINAIGFGVRHFAQNPALQDELRANPALIPEAVEELLRRYTFVSSLRLVVRETEIGGQTVMPGERLTLFTPAADLDASEFPDPDRFDLYRENKVHSAFGLGPHRCLGSHLARIELKIVYTEWLARAPTFRLDLNTPIRFNGGPIISMENLPLRWD